MEIRPINSEQNYQAALARIEDLMGARANTSEGDELDILVTLVEVYEQRQYPFDAPDPIAAIVFRMEQQGLTRKDLEPYIGHSGRVAEVLNHKRALSLKMIRRLNDGLGIPLESLIKPIELAS